MKKFHFHLLIKEPAGIERKRDPVRIGVPLPRGYLHDVSHLKLKDTAGVLQDLQVTPLAYWPDQTVKWALLDFFAAVSGKADTTLSVVCEGGINQPASSMSSEIELISQDENFVVRTGVAEFTVSRKTLAPFSSVRIGNTEILASQGSEILLQSVKGQTLPAEIDEFCVEEAGQLRCTLRAQGRFRRTNGKPFANFNMRLAFFAGMSIVQLEFLIHNPQAARHPGGIWDLGDPGSIIFQNLSIILKGSGPLQDVNWQAESGDDITRTNATQWKLYQDSSGGNAWNSKNHIDGSANLTVSFPGYRVSTFNGNSEERIAEGSRAIPFVRVNTSSSWLAQFRISGKISPRPCEQRTGLSVWGYSRQSAVDHSNCKVESKSATPSFLILGCLKQIL